MHVLINPLNIVIPRLYPWHYTHINVCPHKPPKPTHTHFFFAFTQFYLLLLKARHIKLLYSWFFTLCNSKDQSRLLLTPRCGWTTHINCWFHTWFQASKKIASHFLHTCSWFSMQSIASVLTLTGLLIHSHTNSQSDWIYDDWYYFVSVSCTDCSVYLDGICWDCTYL